MHVTDALQQHVVMAADKQPVSVANGCKLNALHIFYQHLQLHGLHAEVGSIWNTIILKTYFKY